MPSLTWPTLFQPEYSRMFTCLADPVVYGRQGALMNRTLKVLGALTSAALLAGCTLGKSETFTFTADLPPNFYYRASAVYVPAKGETCSVPGGKNTRVGYNRPWPKDYKNESIVALYRTVSGCPLVISRLIVDLYGKYGDDFGDFGSDSANLVIREELPDEYKEKFNQQNESAFYGQCEWLFRTSGGKRRIVKILDCKDADASGTLNTGRPVAGYTFDQLPGKTVKIIITLNTDERPYMKDTWVKVPNGWKRCMGKSFKDQSAFCYGNYKDFSSFMMPDGKQCTIYPGCTE